MEKLRVGVTLKGRLAAAFKKEASRTYATDATLMRLALVEYLSARGHDLTDEDAEIDWGGARRSKSEGDDQGEVVAVAVR